MQISESLWETMPENLKPLFQVLPNPGKEEVIQGFPETKSGALNQASITAKSAIYGEFNGYSDPKQYTPDQGSASRFFYCAKASRRERNAGLEDPGVQFQHGDTLRKIENKATNRGNNHPCVKPLNLMKYLVRLVTPPNGLVLDPFCGSGSTGCAAVQEGMNFAGIELSEEYCEIARARIRYWATHQVPQTSVQETLDL